MAKSRHNEVMQGASGKIGNNLVFRQRGDQTVIARRGRRRNVVHTEKQLEVQNRFLDASLYAKNAVKDQELRAAYLARATINQTAYNVAMKDYWNSPELRRLNDRDYRGEVGDILTLVIHDVLYVREVKVEILDADGELIESGQAQPDSDITTWIYEVTEPNPDYENCSYRVTMVDTPQHVTVDTLGYGERAAQ